MFLYWLIKLYLVSLTAGDKLEAVHVFGEHDECLTLLERVTALHHGPTWLSHMDTQLKQTLLSQLQNCLLEHLYNGLYFNIYFCYWY